MRMDMRNFLSEFITKEDVKENKTWKIKNVNVTLIDNNEKLQLNLVSDDGLNKTLTLNQTNLKILMNLFKYETDKWINKKINLTTVKANYKGEIIDSITVDDSN